MYLRGDPYESSDPVFGVKQSLIVDLTTVSREQALRYGVTEGGKLLAYNFQLVNDAETRKLRDEKALAVIAGLEHTKLKLVHGLPVPDID